MRITETDIMDNLFMEDRQYLIDDTAPGLPGDNRAATYMKIFLKKVTGNGTDRKNVVIKFSYDRKLVSEAFGQVLDSYNKMKYGFKSVYKPHTMERQMRVRIMDYISGCPFLPSDINEYDIVFYIFFNL